MRYRKQNILLVAPLVAVVAWHAAAPRVRAEETDPKPVKVFATVPNLAALARAVGGDALEITTLINPTEDPHFGEPRPSFMKALHEADVLLLIGMDMENGYLDPLLVGARNGRVQPGRPGFVVASSVITPLQRPAGIISRAMGDVHALGNPHFLLDPVSGLAVADLIRTRLSSFDPARSAEYDERYERLKRRIGDALVGKALNDKYDGTKLARLYSAGRLGTFLESQGDAGHLGGWLGRMTPLRGTPVMDDHDMWPYFAERFGIRIAGHLEPVPGILPTTKHLRKIVDRMKAEDIEVVIAAPYYDPRHARFIEEQTGARIAHLAHQVGAFPDARDYVDMVDYNVRTLADTITGAP